MRVLFAAALLLLMPVFAYSEDAPDMMPGFDEVIFEVAGDAVFAPRAAKDGNKLEAYPDGLIPGWTQANGEGYFAFDADEVFPKEEGTLEIAAVVLHAGSLTTNSDELEALVTLYDREKTPIFAVGMNAREVSVGSYPLHPVVMERVFGGTSFIYRDVGPGPLKDGDGLTITVTWGREPSDNRVYVDGRFIDLESRECPRNMGSPGFEPEDVLGSYMHGFDPGDGRQVGPPRSFVIGRIGEPSRGQELSMRIPQAVAIKRVRVKNTVFPP